MAIRCKGDAKSISLDLLPIGVEVLTDPEEEPGARVYHGVSFCDAVRRATNGERIAVRPGSIEVCKWSPAVLGLKKPENSFERSLEPRIEKSVSGFLLAPLSDFGGPRKPDVVILRGRPAELLKLVGILGEEAFARDHGDLIGRSALGRMMDKGGFKVRLSRLSNSAAARMSIWKRFDSVTRSAFKSRLLAGVLEVLIRDMVADMSMCRNSVVIPFLEKKANVSFFCVGGISWGGNSPENMTCGLPYGQYGKIARLLDFSAAG